MSEPLPVLPLSYATTTPLPPRRWWRLPVVAVAGFLAALALGAATNFINGFICLAYFQVIVGWMYGTMTIGDVVTQGLFEAQFFGIVLAVVMTVSYSASTGARWPLGRVFRLITQAMTFCLAGWVVGGVAGLAWGAVFPDGFRRAFPDSRNVASILRFAWVGGSIMGVQLAGGISIIALPILTHGQWRRFQRIG